MNLEKIQCEVCGAKVHAIRNHLAQEHGPESSVPVTYEDYQKQFPAAPLLSPMAEQKLKERQKQAGVTPAAKPKPTAKPGDVYTLEGWSGQGPEPSYAKLPLHEVFGLPKAGLLTKNNEPIMVSVSQREDAPDRVPLAEEYYPDQGALRNVLMALEFNEPIMVYGHAGVGKTSIYRYICRHTNRRLVRVQHTAETQEHKIVGQMQVKKDFDETGKAYSFTEFMLGDLPLAMKNGWVYLADEIDRAQPEVLSAYQSVLEGQPLHLPEASEEDRVITPHPDFRFVATGNSNGMGDETGIHRAVMRQDAATFERFSIVMQLDYLDSESEITMLEDKARVSNAHAKKLRSFAEKIRSQFPHDFPLTIGPRVLIKIGTIGRMKGNYAEGVKLAYANRLGEAERKAAMELATRTFG